MENIAGDNRHSGKAAQSAGSTVVLFSVPSAHCGPLLNTDLLNTELPERRRGVLQCRMLGNRVILTPFTPPSLLFPSLYLWQLISVVWSTAKRTVKIIGRLPSEENPVRLWREGIDFDQGDRKLIVGDLRIMHVGIEDHRFEMR